MKRSNKFLFVRAHGRITRREAAELCQISSSQARDLLAKLVKKGVLMRQGRHRGIFYVQPSTIMDVSKREMDESTKSAERPKSGRHTPYQPVNDCTKSEVLS